LRFFVDPVSLDEATLLTGLAGKPGVLLLIGSFDPPIGRLGPLIGYFGPLIGKLGPLIGNFGPLIGSLGPLIGRLALPI
jgi:hypothetical protein